MPVSQVAFTYSTRMEGATFEDVGEDKQQSVLDDLAALFASACSIEIASSSVIISLEYADAQDVQKITALFREAQEMLSRELSCELTSPGNSTST